MQVLILLPPSEGKTASVSGSSLELDSFLDVDRLTVARREVMSVLAEVSRGDGGASVPGLGPCSAKQVTTNPALEALPCVPAHQLFTGVLYEATRPDPIVEEAADRVALERHYVVLLGLWGILSPTDLVPDHRLSIGTSLPGPGRLPAFRKQHLARSLARMVAQGLVMGCRSADYTATWKPSTRDDTEVVNVRVMCTADDDSYKVVSRVAKHARGLLTGEPLRAVTAEPVPERVHANDIATITGHLEGISDVEVGGPGWQGRRVLTLVTR